MAPVPADPGAREGGDGVVHAPRRLILACALLVALAAPGAAWGHAALLKTFPAASAEVNTPPPQVRLTYSEAVEPRFAIVSVTNAAAGQQVDGAVRRSATNPNQLVVPLKRVPEGWYLVFWRVISVDGHPVRGAFTFKVGPNPGPPPRFVVPSLSETATTPNLLAARWITFLSIMAAVGLFVLRIAIARPVVSRVAGTRLRAVSIAFWIALAVALVATPIYVLVATAEFALRSVWSIGDLVPLMRVSSFGRGYLDIEFALGLFALAAAAALWLDRPERAVRSVAALLALLGALMAAAAALLGPAAAGHAAQTSPRCLALGVDWVHVGAGSLWIGGLIGLLVLWRSLEVGKRVAGLLVCVPRFSTVALASVIAIWATGITASVLHLPTVSSLWSTSYGHAILWKVGILFIAMTLGAVNKLRSIPGLAATGDGSVRASRLLRRLVGVEVLLVASAIFAAAVLSSLPPPPKALAGLGKVAATVGPGRVVSVVSQNGYRVELRVTPNRAAVDNAFGVRITKDGKAVTGADVTQTFAMLDMEMPSQSYRLPERSPGLYVKSTPALVMVGRWGLTFEIAPPGKAPFDVVLVDRANG
ncbi:MAG TPA: copper resistance protein CopC [Gaiellaceae bacterium]|nr:copper resistance protein CopC [Gaiellaceae bacterium]